MTIKANSIVSDKPETLHCYLKLTISTLWPPYPIHSIDYGYDWMTLFLAYNIGHRLISLATEDVDL